MELYEVGIEYEGMVALFSTMDKAKAYVAKHDLEAMSSELRLGYITSEDKYRSAYYISPVLVDGEA